MERLKDLIGNLDREKLMQRLIGSDYAFAAWKLPNSEKKHFIVSFSSPSRESREITSLERGFIINRFNDSHPVSPYHIKADLIFEEEVYVNPNVNATEIEAFEAFLTSPTSKQSSKSKSKEEPARNEFEEIVNEAVKEIADERFEKVVLSRTKQISLPDHFSASKFFDSICETYENAFCSLVNLPEEEVWVGATPELLISDSQARFKTIALAGTKKLEADQTLSEIAWTQKEIEEQAFVSRYIINCFKKIRLREFHEHGPKTVKAGNLAHLKTEFQVNYDELSFEGLADQMIDLLHPTSAVCGMPLQEARDFIEEKETYDRSFYSGFLGPVNFEESTDLFVNLRCMNIKEDIAELYAGAGITLDSNPEKEFQETELKMETLLSLISQ